MKFMRQIGEGEVTIENGVVKEVTDDFTTSFLQEMKEYNLEVLNNTWREASESTANKGRLLLTDTRATLKLRATTVLIIIFITVNNVVSTFPIYSHCNVSCLKPTILSNLSSLSWRFIYDCFFFVFFLYINLFLFKKLTWFLFLSYAS